MLINIGPNERVRHGDLASRVILSRTGLTRMVDRLAERGSPPSSPTSAS
ncbi:MAG: hypothetical protein V9G19_01145 [Tetrasphaera sp.]